MSRSFRIRSRHATWRASARTFPAFSWRSTRSRLPRAFDAPARPPVFLIQSIAQGCRMDAAVQPVTLASADERALLLQPLLDAQGPEIDRRHELTPEVVDAL